MYSEIVTGYLLNHALLMQFATLLFIRHLTALLTVPRLFARSDTANDASVAAALWRQAIGSECNNP